MGVETVDIIVDPLPDGETEADETVIVTISFRTLYVIAPPDNATLTIVDGSQPPPPSNLPPVAAAAATPTIVAPPQPLMA